VNRAGSRTFVTRPEISDPSPRSRQLVNVLLVAPYPPKPDGIGVHTRILAAHLAAIPEMQVGIVTSGRSCVEDGPEVHRVLGASPMSIERVVATVRRTDADVLHYQFAIPALGLAGLWAIAGGLLARRRSGTRLVFTLHEIRREIRLLGPVGRLFYEFLARAADAIIVYGPEAAELAIGCGAVERNVHVMPHGLARAAMTTPPAAEISRVRAAHGVRARNVVVAPGYIHPDKGTGVLVEAFGRLGASTPDLRENTVLVIAGAVRPRQGVFRLFERKDHQFEAQLRSRVEQLGLEGSVVFTGFLPDDDLTAMLHTADVVACPYLEATQSGILNLAIAAGRACVVSDLPGLVHNIGPDAITATPGDADSLAAGLRRVLENPQLQARLEQSQRANRELLTFDNIATRLSALYAVVATPR